jgi:hypothetical protein
MKSLIPNFYGTAFLKRQKIKHPAPKINLPTLQMTLMVKDGNIAGRMKLMRRNPMMTIRPVSSDSRKAKAMNARAIIRPIAA